MTDSILRSYQYYSQTTTVPFPAPSPLPLEVSFIAHTRSDVDSAAPSFAGASIGALATDDDVRTIMVVCHTAAAAGVDVTVTSALIGGITATIPVAIQANSGGAGRAVSIIYADVPTGTTATIDLTLSNTSIRHAIGVYRLLNLHGVDDTETDVTATALTGSVTLTTVADGAIIAGQYTSETAANTHAWTNVNEDYDIASSENAGTQSTGGFATGTSAGSVAVSCVSNTGTITCLAQAGISFH